MTTSFGTLQKLASVLGRPAASEIRDLLDTGSPLSATEVAYLTGAVAGVPADSKCVVLGTSKALGTITTGTITTLSCTDLDAGASGTAGSVDVFPSTSSKGKLSITAAANAADTTTTVNKASQAAARTYTLADALANADFILGQQAAVARTASADGLTTGTIADAGKIQSITVTSADANNIVVLPTPTPGTLVVLCNAGTGFELRTSAPATISINGGAEANAESAIAANTMVIAYCKSATAWAALSLVGTTLAAVEAAAA